MSEGRDYDLAEEDQWGRERDATTASWRHRTAGPASDPPSLPLTEALMICVPGPARGRPRTCALWFTGAQEAPVAGAWLSDSDGHVRIRLHGPDSEALQEAGLATIRDMISRGSVGPARAGDAPAFGAPSYPMAGSALHARGCSPAAGGEEGQPQVPELDLPGVGPAPAGKRCNRALGGYAVRRAAGHLSPRCPPRR